MCRPQVISNALHVKPSPIQVCVFSPKAKVPKWAKQNMNLTSGHHCCLWALLLLSYNLLVITCLPLNLSRKSALNELRPRAIDMSQVLKLLSPQRHDKIEKRSITAFVTDPALLVTILHSLEVAYWTLPFGFILTPIINLFRMPNRRRMEVRKEAESLKVQQFYQTLTTAIEKIEKLNNGKSLAVPANEQKEAV